MAQAAPASLKIVMMGSGGVGKSTLTIRLVTNQFLEHYDPTIEDSYRKDLTVDGENVRLDILDTAGQEEYSTMHDMWISGGKGFLLVYSIDAHDTFENVEKFKDKILRSLDVDLADIPIVLVGNKADLEDQRQVTYEEGKELAARWGKGFVETSAKTGLNTEEAFYMLIRAMRKHEPSKPVEVVVEPEKPVINCGPNCVLL